MVFCWAFSHAERRRKKERETRVAYFWRKRTLLSRGAKECLAFDLYSLLKVADAQTSSGTSRIVLAPSTKHARQGYFWYSPKIQNQHGILLTIYVGVSSALYPESVRDAFTTRQIYNCP